MSKKLSCSIGQYSHAGRKGTNHDSYGVVVPSEPYLSTKGIAIAIADGVSTSDVSNVASQTSVRSFLEDYYSTSETWPVKTAALRVLAANNSWLFSQNQSDQEFRLNKNKGYACTFNALVLKSKTAHLFHVGDIRVSRLRNCNVHASLDVEVLTKEHSRFESDGKSSPTRALGTKQQLDMDYSTFPLEVGNIFVLATDNVYEHASEEFVFAIIDAYSDDLYLAAQKLVERALEQGSDDSLTVQVVRIDSLPCAESNEFLQHLSELPFPPELKVNTVFDGYQVVRGLYNDGRSKVVLAQDVETKEKVVIKLPSIEGREDPSYVERFLMEEWIANRIDNPHVAKSHNPDRARNFCYVATEFIDGKTLAQWMADNPLPSFDEVRAIIEQIAIGLQAFHRQEMLHQDLTPNNIMIDSVGTVKIIDFGSTFVSGIDQMRTSVVLEEVSATTQFLAPEYFRGEFASKQSDLYSLACIAYHMLSGRSPYGTEVPGASAPSAQHRLVYQSVTNSRRELPAWVDLTLRKALQADSKKRYAELSEFIQDLRRPNVEFITQSKPPLIERDPVRFWQGICAVLSMVLLYSLLR